ncbi:MAG: sulfatase-like hydrolase/transferase [Deinococcota bacterium]
MPSQQPNIIFFFTDQQRHDTTGVHGNPLELTPNFDLMAQEGTHLFNTFTMQPVCGPARACLQTGKYATTTGCFKNGIALPKHEKTLAHYFNDAGYDTAYIGKWHLAGHDAHGPVAEDKRGGYQYWLAANLLEFVSDAYDMRLYDNNNDEVNLPGYRVDAQTDAAIRYVSQTRDNPFFLFLSYLEPHHQNHLDDYPPPMGYRERYAGRYTPPDLAALGGTSQQHLAGYYGMVKRLDEALGRLKDALISSGQLDNTIIVYTSDHGCHFKTRNSEYKRSGHEASIRVPTAIQGPGFNSGGRRQELVSLLDLPPTLLDAAGIPVPDNMQGHSLMPLLQGKTSTWQDDVLIQISESQVGRALRTKRWKYGVTAPNKSGQDDPNSDVYEEEFLYDLDADPYELKNLIHSLGHKGVCEDLQERLRKRMTLAGEHAPEIQAVPKEKIWQYTITDKPPYVYEG